MSEPANNVRSQQMMSHLLIDEWRGESGASEPTGKKDGCDRAAPKIQPLPDRGPRYFPMKRCAGDSAAGRWSHPRPQCERSIYLHHKSSAAKCQHRAQSLSSAERRNSANSDLRARAVVHLEPAHGRCRADFAVVAEPSSCVEGSFERDPLRNRVASPRRIS